MNGRVTWTILAAAFLGLALFSLRRAGSERSALPPGIALLGPLAEVASSLQWVRFEDARRSGRTERALALAESAIRLRPRATDGWWLYAYHLSLDLASAEREPDPTRRAAWFRAGVAVTRRGAEHAEHPARLARLRGVLCLVRADTDPDLGQDGAEALRREARISLALAEELERAEKDAP